jgi:hypothetical protein
MIETSLSAWTWIFAAIIISSLSGLSLVRLVPWTNAARQARIPLAFGLAIAPLLSGLFTVLALGVFPGKSHSFHLAVIFSGLLAMWPIGLNVKSISEPTAADKHGSGGLLSWIFLTLLAVWVVGLLADTLFIPLTQNDSLEYATVGRLLFDLRSLSAYPALNPAIGSSGFYGPWTHPPLYPALIYLSNVFQGHADAPGLMRMIAPWFALSTVGLVLTLGCLERFTTGVIAAIVFLSAPLFYLGAGSALLDSLPVQGMMLIICAVVGVDSKTMRYGLVIGLTVGAAMWTHSQTVLFLPLTAAAICLNAGWQKPRFLLKQIVSMLVCASIVAAWPYFRNLKLFGAFISDNPDVFALENLRWVDYFTFGRGLESWMNKLQYGFFKGWFAPEAYSISFWLMLIGAYFYLRKIHRQHLWRNWLRGDMKQVPQRWKNTMLGVILCYLIGVALSILMGINLMIKNERYLLILMPLVAIFAGSGISRLIESIRDPSKIKANTRFTIRKLFTSTALLLIMVVFTAQLLTIGSYRWRTFGLSLDQIGLSIAEKIRSWPAYSVIDFLKTHTPQTATVLSLKPADMYYAKRRMISYLDPRLLLFYQSDDTTSAYRGLVDLGIRYVHIPDYSLPPMYNSVLQDLLARPDLARLLHSDGGYQIYELVRSDIADCTKTIDISPGSVPWTNVSLLVIGGRKALYKLSLAKSRVNPQSGFDNKTRFPFFHRDLSTRLISEASALKPNANKVKGSARDVRREYRLDLELEGYAYVQVYLMQYNTEGEIADYYLLGETVLGHSNPVKHFKHRFVVQPESSSISIFIEYPGKTRLRVRRAAIVPICNS